MTDPHFILQGIAGSNAHGLAYENSDFDYRGVYSFPTADFWVFNEPPESITTHKPDSSAHELKKFLRLALKGNPDVIETFALDTYRDFDLEWGPRLLELLPAVLSNKLRSAYTGYANATLNDILKQGDDFVMTLGDRNWKTAKHFFRLLESGAHAVKTGELKIQVDDPGWYLDELPTMPPDKLRNKAIKTLNEFREFKSVLPDGPDTELVEQYLFDYREAH